jgi:histidine phosphotransferase ChpT
MSNTIDTSMLELLASKICHDLINPIGAVNNGIEFMEDMGPDAGPEARELIAFSAAQATAKLQAFRLAYGAGGADSNIKPADIHKAIDQIVSLDKKIKQDWDPQTSLGGTAVQPAFCKLLICALLLAMESLPKGGALSVSADGESVVVCASGTGSGLRGRAADALKLAIPFAEIEPKDVHAAMTAIMAQRYNFSVSVNNPGENSTEFHIRPA